VLASWTIAIPISVKSMNDRAVNVRGWRGRNYKRERDAWQWALKVCRINERIAISHSKRRVSITRVYSGSEREMDRANMIGGCKMVLDAMVREGIITGDSPRWLQDNYAQFRGEKSSTVITIEELA
jgi:hypothetical protein